MFMPDRSETSRERLQRRDFLKRSGATIPLLYGATAALAGAQPAQSDTDAFAPGLITRQKQPDNLEFPFASLNSFYTPNEQFFLRTHFEVPKLQANDWRLKVEGHVERPFEISYDEIRKVASETLTALLECSGNSRVFLKAPQLGVRWEQGAVGNARWTGVPLAALLERAGVKEGAVDVILEGFDKGKVDPPLPATPGEIYYARSMPLKKALQPEVLLAHQMNGEELTPEHGFPVRAVVAGWYGMASVKWLRRIIVTDREFNGYFQTFAYTTWQRQHDGLPTLVPVTEMDVKSQIARPALHQVIPANSKYRVFGAAWAGEPDIVKVEISTDGGTSWAPAKLTGESAPYAWRFFEYEWQTPQHSGKRVLMSRATDKRGRVQPMQRDSDRRDAMITHVQPIEVLVKG